MLGDETYRQWTGAFHEGSYYEGSWDKGSIIRFVSIDDKKQTGMLGRIAENRPYEFVSIEYLGEIVDGQEDTTSNQAKQWIGAHENYTFSEINGVTTVAVELEGAGIDHDMLAMFEGMWPPALDKLKEIAEK